jgi:hypothetical protein
MLAILTSARVGEHVTGHVGQRHRVVQLAIGQKSSIRGDHRIAELEPQSAVEIEPQRPAIRFTRWVHHAPPSGVP